MIILLLALLMNFEISVDTTKGYWIPMKIDTTYKSPLVVSMKADLERLETEMILEKYELKSKIRTLKMFDLWAEKRIEELKGEVRSNENGLVVLLMGEIVFFILLWALN